MSQSGKKSLVLFIFLGRIVRFENAHKDPSVKKLTAHVQSFNEDQIDSEVNFIYT